MALPIAEMLTNRKDIAQVKFFSGIKKAVGNVSNIFLNMVAWGVVCGWDTIYLTGFSIPQNKIRITNAYTRHIG